MIVITLISECRVFLKAVLNLNVAERFDSTQIQLSGWAGMQPITRPRGFAPQKYTIENCLPQLLHGTHPSPSLSMEGSGSHLVLTSPYPSLQPFTLAGGAVGRTPMQYTPPLTPFSPIHHPHSIRQSTYSAVQQSSAATPGEWAAGSSRPSVGIPTIPPPPQIIQGINPQLHSHGQSSSAAVAGAVGGGAGYTPVRRPLVAKIGAAGRKIADAVKGVGHGKGHSSSSRHGSAGSSKSSSA